MNVALPHGVIFIERDWLSCNQILLIDERGRGDRATLIDTGYVKHVAMTVQLVRRALERPSRPPIELARIITTHLHSDHCGGHAHFRQAFGCRIDVPRGDFEAVRQWDERHLNFFATDQQCERFDVDGFLSPGDWIELAGDRWQALPAPGHDPNALILHCPQHRLLISGDALWQNGFGLMFGELAGRSAFAEQLATLDLIESLDVHTVLPGHGPAFGDVREAIVRSRQRLRALAADPLRNARTSLKVLIKFHLLDVERCDWPELLAHLGRSQVLAQCAAILSLPFEEALRWGVEQLTAQGELRCEGAFVCNA